MLPSWRVVGRARTKLPNVANGNSIASCRVARQPILLTLSNLFGAQCIVLLLSRHHCHTLGQDKICKLWSQLRDQDELSLRHMNQFYEESQIRSKSEIMDSINLFYVPFLSSIYRPATVAIRCNASIVRNAQGGERR
jgi:hypothetical protein